MGNPNGGGIPVAAGRLAIAPSEYRRRIASGQRWCWFHWDWHPIVEFGKDASRKDGRARICRQGNRDREWKRAKGATS